MMMVVAVFLLWQNQAFGSESILRAGDVLSISLPGESRFSEPFRIDRQGRVTLPETGRLLIAGLSNEDALEVVRASLSSVYRDLSRLSLAIMERRLPVTVLGYVRNPGPVDLEDGATIQIALSAAGGISPGAQLDRLRLRRGDRESIFNYKNYLDTGDLSLIPELMPLDVIFVPASPLTGNVQVEFDARTLNSIDDAAEDGSSITVFGEVHRPGAYAFKAGATIIDMIMRAGGVTRYAGVEQIRIISEGNPILFNMREYLDTADKSLMPGLNMGDTIFVPQVTDQIQGGSRTVYVMGEVFKPGAYETKDDASFFDILATAGGPTRFAETRRIRIIHADGKVSSFDLSAYTEGNKGITPPTILPGDAILVPEKVDMNEKSWLEVAPQRAIRIIGAVNRPGRYEWSGEMSVMDLIAHAGGPRAEADTAHVQVLSADADGSVAAIEFDLKRFLEKGGDLSSLPSLKAGDTLVVPELPRVPNDNRSQWVRQSSERSIHIFGQVGAPGRYAFNEDLNFLDILSAAQGPTANADLRNVRITHRGEVGARTTHLNLALYFETGDESMLPKVRSEDVIYIPERNRAWLENSKETTVRVLGAVGKPGRYKFDDSMTILDLLAEAGGPTDLAVLDNITVVNITKEEPRARSFDLVAFAKSGDFTTLPVLRNGDTVFVASINQSDWKIFSEGISSAVSILSLVLLVTGL